MCGAEVAGVVVVAAGVDGGAFVGVGGGAVDAVVVVTAAATGFAVAVVAGFAPLALLVVVVAVVGFVSAFVDVATVVAEVSSVETSPASRSELVDARF